jgi:DNA-binding response OmpR family regulator
VEFVTEYLPAPKRAKRATILLVDDDPFQAFAHRAALERDYASIERVADASSAFIRVQEPEFGQTLALVVAGLRLPGLAGPAFVNELKVRVPTVPVLVIGRLGETAAEYSGENIGFVPRNASAEELLAGVRALLSKGLKLVA